MPEPSIRIPYDRARARATVGRWREKVFAYITRRPEELLVFAHTEEYPDAGIQVPAGGVEAGEDPADAVIRETYEESGLRLGAAFHLASFEWLDQGPSRIGHFYWLQAPLETADHWEHRVSAGDDDAGMIFRYSFAARSNPGLLPGVGFESGLADLDRVITSRS